MADETRTLYAQAKAIVDRLGFRLAAVLAIALLPLMIVSIVRSETVIKEARQRSEAALVGATLSAVHSEVIQIERALAVAQSLSHTVQTLLQDTELCRSLMKDKLKDTSFSFAGFYDPTGYVECSSADAPFRFEKTPDLERQVADPSPVVLVNKNAPISGTSVIYASHPVFADTGELLGFTAISVPHRELREGSEISPDATFITMTIDGRILTSTSSLDTAELYLPSLPAEQSVSLMPASFQAVGRDGIERLYAVVPVVGDEIFALATWPWEDQINGEFYLSNPALFPTLMWLASFAVAWFATTLFVTRPVVRIQKAMAQFAKSRKLASAVEFRDAPRELREVASSFLTMSDTILRDDANLEDALHQKDVLLREVHHRVKNNLQLIASIMSMQMRQSRSPEVQRLLRSLHDRVNSLATIHQNLYQTSGQADIKMSEHLDAIVRQVIRMGAEKERTIDLRTDFEDLTLNPDQAVPLSLFVTEAMTNALKYIGAPDGQQEWLRVSMRMVGDSHANLQIENSLPDRIEPPDAEKSSGLGSELMEAFADQLDGEMTKTGGDGSFVVTLEFQIDDLVPKPE